MKFNSNVFWKLIGIFAVMDLCLLMAGCGDWETQASAIISMLGPAIQAAIAILTAFGVGVSADVMAAFTNWSQQTQNALVQLKGLIDQYSSALATAKPGILEEIQTVINTTATNLSSILTTLHVTDSNTQAKIAAVFAAISAMLVAVLNIVPVVQGKVSDHHEEARLYVAYKDTAKSFKSTFNAAAGAFGSQYTI